MGEKETVKMKDELKLRLLDSEGREKPLQAYKKKSLLDKIVEALEKVIKIW